MVLFGAAPSPFLLNATIQYHLNRKNDWISKDLKTSIYMDNVLSGTSNPQQAIEYHTSSRQYFKEADMNLRQWTSNDDTINKMASQDGACAEDVTNCKVLGLVWNSNIDSLSLSLDKLIQEIHALQSITKRSVLSLSSKLFDPLRFVEPVSAKGKIMMHELWKMKMPWDTR